MEGGAWVTESPGLLTASTVHSHYPLGQPLKIHNLPTMKNVKTTQKRKNSTMHTRGHYPDAMIISSPHWVTYFLCWHISKHTLDTMSIHSYIMQYAAQNMWLLSYATTRVWAKVRKMDNNSSELLNTYSKWNSPNCLKNDFLQLGCWNKDSKSIHTPYLAVSCLSPCQPRGCPVLPFLLFICPYLLYFHSSECWRIVWICGVLSAPPSAKTDGNYSFT